MNLSPLTFAIAVALGVVGIALDQQKTPEQKFAKPEDFIRHMKNRRQQDQQAPEPSEPPPEFSRN
jgi:hypothetical protein